MGDYELFKDIVICDICHLTISWLNINGMKRYMQMKYMPRHNHLTFPVADEFLDYFHASIFYLEFSEMR